MAYIVKTKITIKTGAMFVSASVQGVQRTECIIYHIVLQHSASYPAWYSVDMYTIHYAIRFGSVWFSVSTLRDSIVRIVRCSTA